MSVPLPKYTSSGVWPRNAEDKNLVVLVQRFAFGVRLSATPGEHEPGEHGTPVARIPVTHSVALPNTNPCCVSKPDVEFVASTRHLG